MAYNTPRPPRSVHKKFKPNRSSHLAGYRQHIYTNDVSFYCIDFFVFSYEKKNRPAVCFKKIVF